MDKSPLLSWKKISIFLILFGLTLFIIGLYRCLHFEEYKMEELIKNNPERFKKVLFSSQNTHYFSHLLHNRPLAAFYVSAFYFTGVTIGVLFFIVIQHVSNAGWVTILFPVMECIYSFLPYVSIGVLIILILNALGFFHIFTWMIPSFLNPYSLNYNELIANKSPFLNIPFFILRSFIYITLCTFFIFRIKLFYRKLYKKEDYSALRKASIGFILFFAFSSMGMGWDWIMSINAHWFSTLFSWYVICTHMVNGITTITMVSIFLKKNGYLSTFNSNHMHDLAKYMFSTSLLWTYLWFSQFLLCWYGNIPEEVSYFLQRSELYKNIHFWMLFPTLLFPFIGLIRSNVKRKPRIVFFIGCIILIGHYIDIYNMIMPDCVGVFSGFGFTEIGSFLFLSGFFLFFIFRKFKKSNIEANGHPFFIESKYYEYPF